RLMQARDGLAPEEIDLLSAAIKELWSSVDHWSRGRRLDQVATLTYALTPESLTLTVHDEAGWLPAWRDLAPDDPSKALAEARFDQIIVDEADHSLKLLKRLATR